MKVFITGGSGFIGSSIVAALCRRGHQLTILARQQAAARIEAARYSGVDVVVGDFTGQQDWLHCVEGHDVVVNCVGVIRQSHAAPFRAVHETAPIALFDACRRLGVRKVVQISALGARPDSVAEYHRTKAAADEFLARSGLQYVILRPSVVYGPGDHSMKLLMQLAASPVHLLPGGGEFHLQPLFVEDLARAVVAAVEDPDFPACAVDAAGKHSVSFRELLRLLSGWLGTPPAPAISVPWCAMRALARSVDLLGGRGPITSEELTLLRQGSTCDLHLFEHVFGFVPLPLEAGLARRDSDPGAVRDARLAWVRAPLRLAIAFAWLYSGLFCGLFLPLSDAIALLGRAGVPEPLAGPVFYATCWLEVLLGAAFAFRRWIPAAGAVQLFLLVGFTGILSWSMPELWAHPFGPLSKNPALFFATCAVMALER
jgi:uncharacterized protein YbjT (DUF2867 family)